MSCDSMCYKYCTGVVGYTSGTAVVQMWCKRALVISEETKCKKKRREKKGNSNEKNNKCLGFTNKI